jgi:IclR helix-turn-helix domain
VSSSTTPPRPAQRNYASVPLFFAAALLGLASLATATSYGYARGTEIQSQLTWSFVGLAAGIITLFAPSEGFKALTQREYGRAALALLAAALCGSFAIAGALGSAAGGRQSAISTADHASGERARTLATYTRATNDLAKLQASRTVTEIRALMKPLDARIALADCGNWVASKSTRADCATRNTLQIELARADRRSELEAVIAESGSKLSISAPSAEANSDAQALSRYAAAFGFKIDHAALNDLLTVLAVLVIELGGALSLAVARGGSDLDQTVIESPIAQSSPDPKPGIRLIHSSTQPIEKASDPDLDQAEREIVIRRLTSAGGSLKGSQRKMADQLGVPQSSLHRVLHALADQGLIELATKPRQSTVVRLAAA